MDPREREKAPALGQTPTAEADSSALRLEGSPYFYVARQVDARGSRSAFPPGQRGAAWTHRHVPVALPGMGIKAVSLAGANLPFQHQAYAIACSERYIAVIANTPTLDKADEPGSLGEPSFLFPLHEGQAYARDLAWNRELGLLATISAAGHFNLIRIGQDAGGRGVHFKPVARFRVTKKPAGGSRVVWLSGRKLIANHADGLWELEVMPASEETTATPGVAGSGTAAPGTDDSGSIVAGAEGQLLASREERAMLQANGLRLRWRWVTDKLTSIGDPCGLVVLPGGTHVAHVAGRTTEVFRVKEAAPWVRIARVQAAEQANVYDAICVCTRGRPAWARIGPLSSLDWRYPRSAGGRDQVTPAMLKWEQPRPVGDHTDQLCTFIFSVATGRKSIHVVDLTGLLRSERERPRPGEEPVLTSDDVPDLLMKLNGIDTGSFSLAAAVENADMYEGVGCPLRAAAASACSRRRWVVLGGQAGQLGFIDASDDQPMLRVTQYTPGRSWGLEESHIYGMASLSGGGVALAGVARRSTVWFAPRTTWAHRRAVVVWRWCGNVQRRRRRLQRRRALE